MTVAKRNRKKKATKATPKKKVAQVRQKAAIATAVTTSTSTSIYRAQLVGLYQRYNPEKLARIDELLAKYAGSEDELLKSIRDKYKLNDNSNSNSGTRLLPGTLSHTLAPTPSLVQKGLRSRSRQARI